jgi:hypothetical protein
MAKRLDEQFGFLKAELFLDAPPPIVRKHDLPGLLFTLFTSAI